MSEMMKLDANAIMRLKACRRRLTTQQFKTLRGQVYAGDSIGAMKGLRKILGNLKEQN